MSYLQSKSFFACFVFVSLLGLRGKPQDFLSKGEIHGNFQTDVQYYQPDSKIGITDTTIAGKKVRLNGFANFIYTNGDFSAGLRYEAYLPPMLGFDSKWEGTGIPYRFISYKKDLFEVTVGNFYDQFGNGLIFRCYEEKNLGVDNAMDGIRVKLTPSPGIILKGVLGTQRYYWDPYDPNDRGILKGADAELTLNDIFKSLSESRTRLILGGSFITKYQKANDPIYKLPENVGAFAGRFNLTRGKVGLSGEYAYKINDPSAINNLIYKPGESAILTASYSQKGLGIILQAKRTDNMSFKSNRSELGNNLDINFLPPLTVQHAYTLAAMYPYATQPNGEMGLQGQVDYSIRRNTMLGGRYGTHVTVNYSVAKDIDRQKVNDTTSINESGTLGYKSDFFSVGKQKFFEDINLEVQHKFSKKFKGIFSWINLVYNMDVIEGHAGAPLVYAGIGVADLTYMLNDNKALRLELQHLSTRQDEQNWAMGLLEYSIAPEWFFSVSDQYNYGNDIKDKQVHYYSFSAGYNHKTSRITLAWGRVREGLLCVGGVCRQVPASNGLTITLSSSF